MLSAGRFTAAADPYVETTIASHMQRIVEAVRAEMEPAAILLRGSFGKAEGNVLNDDGQLRFLSDYEINVAAFSPRYRKLFARLASSLSAELGVQTSLVWMRPDFFERLRIGPFAAGAAPATIALYETRYGSRILYGENLLQSAAPIDPTCISVASGLQLMLNRMAESLAYLPASGEKPENEWASLHWINKLILACMELLLVSWGQYHYSYRERGRRFDMLALEGTGFLGEDASTLRDLAQRATQFRLQPARSLYPASLSTTVDAVASLCISIFSHAAFQEWKIDPPATSPLYPEQYLRAQVRALPPLSQHFVLYKLLDGYWYARRRSLPLNLFSLNTAAAVVYSIVPLLFASRTAPGKENPSSLQIARKMLGKVCHLPAASPDPHLEWRQLRDHMLIMWKNFCNG